MNKKLREVLSELATDLKARNYDDKISYRYLNSKFRSKLDYFLRLESKSREFLRDYTLWKKIKFEELEDISDSAHGVYTRCTSLKRSINELPELVNTAYGKLIKVIGLDNSTEYTFIKSIDYKDYMNRPYIKHKHVFWVDDNKIVIPNTNLEAISIYLIPKDESEVDKLNKDLPPCSSSLDGKLPYPDYLITLAKQETLRELLGSYARVVEDEKGDDNSNIKN